MIYSNVVLRYNLGLQPINQRLLDDTALFQNGMELVLLLDHHSRGLRVHNLVLPRLLALVEVVALKALELHLLVELMVELGLGKLLNGLT